MTTRWHLDKVTLTEPGGWPTLNVWIPRWLLLRIMRSWTWPEDDDPTWTADQLGPEIAELECFEELQKRRRWTW